MSRNSRNPISWVPTVYFAMGLPFVVLNMVSVLMFKGLGIDDAQIGLVRYDPCNIVVGQIISFGYFGSHIGHIRNGILEYIFTILQNEMFTIIYGLVT